ncbi:MAG: hypothetical protein ABSA02_30825 [Trebonia sp.]
MRVLATALVAPGSCPRRLPDDQADTGINPHNPPEGRALVARLAGVMRDTEDALMDGLDPDDVRATRRVLAQVAERARALRAERAG